MRQERILSCYAVGRDDSWEAFCVDFDIAVQGESFVDVTQKLGEAIRSFTDYVNNLPQEERERFLKRRAPWHVRAKLVLGVIMTILFGDSSRSKRQSFGVACPV